MEKFTLHPDTTIGSLSLTVANLEMMTDYYQQVIGLKLRAKSEGQAVLGTANEAILTLIGNPQGRAYPQATGLFHFALLMPSRAALAGWLKHLFEIGQHLPGCSDHGVSEALYLSDPEGNGIEVYQDRPRNQWPFANGKLKMVTARLDISNLLQDAPTSSWDSVPDDMTLGHVHLQVDDTRKAEDFYVDVMGFDLMQNDYPGATFVSAGGYHHHLGGNVWHSAGASPPPPNSLGLHSYTIQLPSEVERQRVVDRLQAADYPISNGSSDPLVRDPAGNALVLTVG